MPLLNSRARRWMGPMAALLAGVIVGCGPTFTAPLPMAQGVQGLGYTSKNLELLVEPFCQHREIAAAIIQPADLRGRHAGECELFERTGERSWESWRS